MKRFFFLTALLQLSGIIASPTNGGVFEHENQNVDEWKKYGCGTEKEVGMAACFCDMLRDRPDKPEEGAAVMDTQGDFNLSPADASITVCSGGLAGSYPCSGIDLQSFLELYTFSSSSASDVWGWTDSATGREFAIIGLFESTAFVEITDPVNPKYLGKLPTRTVNSSWRDIKTYKDHAFIGSEATNHGLQVFGLRQLLSVSGTPKIFQESAHYDEIGSSHNVVINEDSGYAYAVGSNTCSGGLHMVDISNPTNPTYAGCFDGDGYTHDAHCVIYKGPDAAYVGREICFACNEDTVTIVDVTNKNSPVMLGRSSYAQDRYTHQGWLSPNHEYFVFGDEIDEKYFGIKTKTLVMNVKDLNNIFFDGAYLGSTAAVDHNLYIKDSTIYLANYRAGLRLLKVNDFAEAMFEEIGFFDIYPSDDLANFNGAWSVYPYFPSGNIVISGIGEGLFIVKPQVGQQGPTAAPTSVPTTPPATCPQGETATEVHLLTDTWSHEDNHFTIAKRNNGNVVMSRADNTYDTTAGILEKDWGCLPNGVYTFTMYDDYGNDGFTNGAYMELFVGGQSIYKKADSATFTVEKFDFTVGSGSSVPPAPQPTPLPTSTPTKPPTSFPTLPPTFAPTHTPTLSPTPGISGSCNDVEFILQTDTWSSEDNHFQIIDRESNTIVMSRADGMYPTGAGNKIVDKKCLPPGNYNLTVYDDYVDDGLTDNAYFELRIGGLKVYSDADIFNPAQWVKVEHLFMIEDCTMVVFALTTDEYSYEDNHFVIVDTNTGAEMLSRPDGYYPREAGTLQEDSRCVPAGQYKLTVFDDWPTDGLTGNANFELKVGGIIRFTDKQISNPAVWTKEEFTFVVP